MTLLYLFLSIVLLILLISWAKFNPFIAFLMVSVFAALLLEIPIENIPKLVEKGIGATLGSFIIIICLGSMLGKLVAETGGAQKITNVLTKAFGTKYIQWALMVTGFIVGIPLFYNVGFVLLVPLLFSVVYQLKLPAVYVGVPMLAALSVTHGFLPPHPSPAYLVKEFKADMGMTLLYGIAIAIPAIFVAGPLFSQTVKKIKSHPLETFQPKIFSDENLPGSLNAFFSALLPVILLIITTVISFFVGKESIPGRFLSFFSDANIVMLLSLLIATYTLGIRSGKTIKGIMSFYESAVKDIAVIILIVAGAGMLKQVFEDSGVSKEIGAMIQNWHLQPLFLGWLIAAILRVCIGSATVAGVTTAGIIGPVIPSMNADPNLMVLSIGAGSLMFSHVNDSGFWMFKEYFNLSIKDTIRSWSLMETVVAIMGLLGVLIINLFI